MTVRIIAQTTLNTDEPEALDQYLSIAGPLVEKAGGVILNQFEVGESIVGETSVQYISIIEYPDQKAVDSVFQSEEYSALTDVRKKAFLTYRINQIK